MLCVYACLFKKHQVVAEQQSLKNRYSIYGSSLGFSVEGSKFTFQLVRFGGACYCIISSQLHIMSLTTFLIRGLSKKKKILKKVTFEGKNIIMFFPSSDSPHFHPNPPRSSSSLIVFIWIINDYLFSSPFIPTTP